MVIYLEGGTLLDLLYQCFEAFIFGEVSDDTAVSADEMVVMALSTNHVFVAEAIIGVFVDPLHDAETAEEVKGAEECGAANRGIILLNCVPKLS